jgi:hypothetical protein
MYIAGAVAMLVITVIALVFLLPPSLATLRQHMAKGNSERQLQALQLLEKQGAEAVPVLILGLNSKDYTVRDRSSRLLRKVGMPAIGDLLTVVEDESGEYNEPAKLAAIKLLGDMRAQEAEKPLYQLAITSRTPDAIRQAAIENVLAIVPRYEKYYSQYDGVWHANAELEKKGYVKISDQWVSLDTFLEKTKSQLAGAQKKLATLRLLHAKPTPPPVGALDALPSLLSPWQECLRHYQVLESLRVLWSYEASLTRVQTTLTTVQHEVAQGIVAVCTELQGLAQKTETSNELYAAEIYAAADNMCTEALAWPWSPSCQAQEKIRETMRPLQQKLAALRQKLQCVVVTSCTVASEQDKVMYEFNELLTRVFKQGGRLPVFRAPLTPEEQKTTGRWFFCHYQEDKARGEAVCSLAYLAMPAEGKAQTVWSHGVTGSAPSQQTDRELAMQEARLMAWKNLREWQPDFTKITKINATVTVTAKVAGSTLYKQTASDAIYLKDGRVLQGLIEEETKEAVHLVYVDRPSKEQQIVARQKIEQSKIAKIERIADDIRKFRLNMIKKSKKSSREEYKNIRLRSIFWEFNPNSKGWEYGDDLFVLQSNADQDFVKQVVVRVREIFQAYQQLFVVTRNVERKLKIFIFNSSREYQAAIGGQIMNPAFYWPEKNYIVAGCDLQQYREEVAKIRSQHEAVKAQIAHHKKEMEKFEQNMRKAKREEHAKLDKALKAGQIAESCYDNAYRAIREWEEKQNEALREYQKQLRTLEDQIRSADYQNMKTVDKYAGTMLKILYHEAFHAFLQNFLFAEHASRFVPLWLNEGMAQFFENAFIEGNSLIIGNMDSQRTSLLKNYIRDSKTIPLQQFLMAESDQFLVRDLNDLENSNIHYLQSWALVYYLSKRYDLSQGNFFAGYVQELAAKADPLEAFARLIQEPLATVDAAWQQELLEGKSMTPPTRGEAWK